MSLVIFEYDSKKRLGILQSDLLSEIREHFSVKIPKYGAARFNKYIPDRKYIITPTGRFHIGLYWEIYIYILKTYNASVIQFTDNFKKTINLRYKDKTVIDRCLRDYQHEIVQKCIVIGMGTVVLATAGGKTFTMASLIESINPVKVLVIVPNPNLVIQTYDDFVKYGINPIMISKWSGDNELNTEAKIIIANRSILQSDNSDIDWIKFIDLLIIDEVHQLRQSNNITKIVDKISTLHKFGFTGTLPENDLDKWSIVGITGPVIYERKAHELRDDNYVANAKALILKVEYGNFNIPEDKKDGREEYAAEVETLIDNDYRNKLITKLCGSLKNNALLLVDRVIHGEVLKTYIEQTHLNKEVYFIQGEMEIEERERIKKLMEQKTNIICIAISSIFATGISINNLHYIVFCNGGKSRIRVIQSIGRGLRLHENKHFLTIIDIADQTKYGSAHADERKKLYNEEHIPFIETSIKE